MKWLKWGGAAFLALIALAGTVLLALGRREGAGRTSNMVEIARPPAVVWAWVEEPDKFRQWVGWVTDVKVEGDRQTVFMKDPNMNGETVRIDSVLKESVPHKRLVVDLSSPMGFSGTMTYGFEDLGGNRTRLTMEGRWVYSHWFAALMEPLVTPQATKKGQEDLARLKQLAER